MTPLPNRLPADFHEHRHKTVAAQMAIYDLGKHTILRWRRESGLNVQERGWSAEELATLKTWSQAGVSIATAAKNMGRGRRSVATAFHRYKLGEWKVVKRVPVLLPIPDDLTAQYATKTLNQLAKHYGVSVKTVRRWVAAKGLKRERKAANVRPVDFKRQAPEARQRFNKDRFVTAPVDRGYREDSAAGDAQRVLQRDGWRPVVRCDAAGRQTAKGRYWICGRAIAISDAELIERAERAERRMMG